MPGNLDISLGTGALLLSASICLLLLPSQHGSSLQQMVRETVSRELSHVIQTK